MAFGSDNCWICNRPANKNPNGNRDGTKVSCSYCGDYTISNTLEACEGYLDDTQRWKLSCAVRIRYNRGESVCLLTSNYLDYIENTFTSNLASVLAFYAYIILGFDFDSFDELAGTPFFDKAQGVVNAAQSAPDKGWRSAENQKNRYWIIENILNSAYSDFRRGIFQYHLNGMDLFSSDAVKARAGISEGVALIQKAYRQKPGLFIISLFMLAKSDELISVFTPAPMVEKTKVVNILKSIDPANSAKYNQLLTTSP